jgi:segregation and condensation protein A
MLATPAYTFQLDLYQGPLDLLLELIERSELDITKIALAEITDQYLEYIHTMEDRSLEDIAAFLVIASRLIQIKSEVLLPRPPVREPGEEDPGDALARQLVAYKKYKQVAILLSEREAAGLRTFLRIAARPASDPQLDLGGVTIPDLHAAMIEALLNAPKPPQLQGSVRAPQVRIRDKIRSLINALTKIGRVSFHKFVHGARSRLEVVVSFLAVLELIKQDQVQASQKSIFGDIELSPGEAWNQDQSAEFDLEFEE